MNGGEGALVVYLVEEPSFTRRPILPVTSHETLRIDTFATPSVGFSSRANAGEPVVPELPVVPEVKSK
jgi:hypothetical protein